MTASEDSPSTGNECSGTDLHQGVTDVIDAFEDVNWREVPEFSAAEAAAVTRRLIEARERIPPCHRVIR